MSDDDGLMQEQQNQTVVNVICVKSIFPVVNKKLKTAFPRKVNDFYFFLEKLNKFQHSNEIAEF